MVFTKEDKLVI